MKSLLVAFAFLMSISVAAEVTPYKTPLMVLGTRYRAIHTCNCLFVIKMNIEYCKNFSKIDPPVFSVEIDAVNKSVSSGIMGMDFKPAVAKYSNERVGCQIITP